jgi:hypothetical protein
LNGAYEALAARIRQELIELQTVAARAVRLWNTTQLRADDAHVDAVALNLHGFYSGLERIFELVAERVDRSHPTGESWHRELLLQMAVEIPGVRPAVLSRELATDLDEYRGFRHVVRNVYSYRLDPRRVGILVDDLLETAGMVTEQLSAFADTLAAIAGSQSPDC